MLKQIKAQNYRQLRDIAISFNPQTTLVCGLNGSGKSTLFTLLADLQAFLARGMSAERLYPAAAVPVWEKSRSGAIVASLELTVKFKNKIFNYILHIERDFLTGHCRVQKEALLCGKSGIFNSQEGQARILMEDGGFKEALVDESMTGLGAARRVNKLIETFLTEIRENLFFVSLEPSKIDGFHIEPATELARNGENFSAWCFQRQKSGMLANSEVFEDLASIIPNLKGFAFMDEGKGKRLHALLCDARGDYDLPFDYLSEGQKALVIFHAIIQQCGKNATVFIDEFENFVSPVELQPLYNLMQDKWEEDKIQFILISHNESTMNWYGNEAVIFEFEERNIASRRRGELITASVYDELGQIAEKL